VDGGYPDRVGIAEKPGRDEHGKDKDTACQGIPSGEEVKGMETETRLFKMIAVPITEANIRIGKEYNRQALEGMLKFLEALYEDVLHDVESEGLDPLDAIKSELAEIHRLKEAWLR